MPMVLARTMTSWPLKARAPSASLRQPSSLSYTSWSHAGLGQCHGYSSNAIVRKGRKAVCDRLKKESDATSATGRRTKSIGLTMTLARRRARGGPRQRKTKDKPDTRGAQSALHAKATGRNRVIRAQTSTSRLSCQRIGGRRMVALLCRGTLSRKRMKAASRRRHPRQAYHRHRLRPKKGSQPWRRLWLSFYAELPSWRSPPRKRPLVQDSHGLGRGLWTKLRLEVLTASRQERYPAHGLWSGLARPGARIPTASGEGSHGLGPGFPRPLARAVAA